MEHRPGSQEQQALEDGVIESVKHRGDQRYRRELRMSCDAEHQSGAKTYEDNPDILDAVLGQQAFQIMLHQSVQDAENGGGDSHNEDHQSGPGRQHP